MKEEGRVSGMVSLFSFLSGWSLVTFGGLSLLVVCFSWSWVGAFISVALLAHGSYEIRERGKLTGNLDASAGKRLAWNQFALAGSVLLYLGWQILAIDTGEIDAMLAREPLRSVLLNAPANTAELLSSELPKFLALFYGIAGFLVLVNCLGMALLYIRAGRKLSATD